MPTIDSRGSTGPMHFEAAATQALRQEQVIVALLRSR